MAYQIKDSSGNLVKFRGRKGLLGQDSFGKIRSFDDSNLSLIGVCSTGEIDRVGDIIVQSGIDLSQYSRNPIVPFCHDLTKIPCARSLKTWSEGKGDERQLLFQPKFMNDDPESVRVYKAYKSGLLAGFSIGFLPVESEPRKLDEKEKEGFMFHTPTTYKKISILEISCVPCPANPSALLVVEGMVGKGLLPAACLGYHSGQEIEVEGFNTLGSLKTFMKIMVEMEFKKRFGDWNKKYNIDGLDISKGELRQMIKEVMNEGQVTYDLGDISKEDLKGLVKKGMNSYMGILDD